MLNFSTKKRILIGLILFSILLLLPLYLIAPYNHPSVDDYFYGYETTRVWQNTQSIRAVIRESAAQTAVSYENWQGNFSAIFLMRLQPGIFGENVYLLSGLILISAFFLCSLYFYYTFSKIICGASKFVSLCFSLILTGTSMQFVPKASDAFYWYNGSIYYTFFYSLALFTLTINARLLHSSKKGIIFLLGILSVLLSFLIGGSNYTTALASTLMAIFFACYFSYLQKKKKAGTKESFKILSEKLVFSHVDLNAEKLIFLWLTAAACLGGLMISVLAPGNRVRQTSVGETTGVLKSILLSFAYGGYSFFHRLTSPVLLVLVLLLPLYEKMAEQLIKKGFRFPHPILAFLLCFCLYSAEGTPIFYAQGIYMPHRLMNIIDFSFYLFASAALVYLIGYLNIRHHAKLPAFTKKLFYPIIVSILIAGTSVCSLTIGQDENDDLTISQMPASLSACYSLVNGDAKAYDAEMNARLIPLTDPLVGDAVLPALTAKPDILFHSDITYDPLNWKNLHMAIYYGKWSVRLE